MTIAHTPVISIIGIENVGKSTLFNTLTNTRKALSSKQPGMTRDRRYGFIHVNGMKYTLVDTGGVTNSKVDYLPYVLEQVNIAIAQSDIIYFLVDSTRCVNSLEMDLSKTLYKTGKKVILVLTKCDNPGDIGIYQKNFSSLGFKNIAAVSSLHRRGIENLLEQTIQIKPGSSLEQKEEELEPITIAIIGKTNVGKSTLINALLKEDRVTVFDQPGTTTDSIEIPLTYKYRKYIIIDTAGIRQKSKIEEEIESLSATRSCESIDIAQVIILVIDGTSELTHQDLRLLKLCFSTKKRVVLIAINKCDRAEFLLRKEAIVRDIKYRFGPLSKAFIHFISAKNGKGIFRLLDDARDYYDHMFKKISTNKITTFLNEIINERTCKYNNFAIKLKFAHVGGHNPLTIIIHGNKVEHLTNDYKRYLENRLRVFLKLENIPLNLIFKKNNNPFAKK